MEEREYRKCFNKNYDFHINNIIEWDRIKLEYEKNKEYKICKNKPYVAIIREQGSNGDQEMAVAFEQAGFEVIDVTMTDLTKEKYHYKNLKE